jgi:cytochrome P450
MLDPLGRGAGLRRRGSLVRLAKATGGMVLVFDPADVDELLSRPDAFGRWERDTSPVRFPADSASSRLISGLLAMQNGAKHRELRRQLTPAFDYNHLKHYFALSRAGIAAFVESLEASDTVQDLNGICHALAMNTALLTLFGAYPGEESHALAEDFRAWMNAAFSPWTLLLPFDAPGTSYGRFLRRGERLEKRLIALFRNRPEAQGSLVQVVFGPDWDRQVTEAELVSRAAGYFQASYETTANTLVWILILLNLHPEAALAAREEIRAVIGEGEIEYPHLAALPYLRAVVLESMRLLPPVLLFPRIAVEDLALGGAEIPKGTRLAYGPALTHRLPEVFEDPLAFKPERFLGPGPRPEGFLAFGGGPRRCPGEQFALNEVLLILAAWLRRGFPRIEPGAKVKCRGLVAHTPIRPVHFRNLPWSEIPGAPPRLQGRVFAGLKHA